MNGYETFSSSPTQNNRHHQHDDVPLSDDDDLVIYNRVTEPGCGIGWWRPKWMQRLARPEVFLINFSVVAIFQGATFTYFVGSLSTLEKRYSFESKISGLILIADNLSQMMVSPLIGHLASKYNRPRIMAAGEMIAAMSCFLLAVPYFVYGPAATGTFINTTDHHHISNSTKQFELCPSSKQCDDRPGSATVWPAVLILWFACFVSGIGYTAFYTIGLPYLDDNTSKNKSPIYLSASAALRLCGPSLGLLLSSFSLSYYEDPTLDPPIARNDPRWIGAWWLGYVILGACIFIFSVPLMMFPKSLMNTRPVKTKIKLNTEALATVKRLAKNPIYMFHMCGVALRLVGYLGYYIYKPKYIEAQFHKSASDANFWTGMTSVPTMAVGIFAGGIILSKCKPKPRNVATYIFMVEILFTFALLAAMSFKCPAQRFPDTEFINGKMLLTSSCNADCHCTTESFQPICAGDGNNFFSPCFAGCSKMSHRHNQSPKFSACKCHPGHNQLTDGYCSVECDQFTEYIALFAVAGVVSSTSKIGDTLITFRSVDPQDKTFAMGIAGSFFALFAFIPYPLLFGFITDGACMVWRESCGRTGNCWLYDIDRFNWNLHTAAFGFMLAGGLLHLMVVFYADRIKNMFDDDDESVEMSLVSKDQTQGDRINDRATGRTRRKSVSESLS